MSDRIYLTKQGYNRMRDELNLLKTVVRKEVLEKIAEARAHGDLSENAEYEAAREQQAQMESKIVDLENKLTRASILDPKQIRTDRVYILTSVKLRNLDETDDEIIEYTLVSSEEADTDQGKISVRSPVGKALIGKAVGEKVQIHVPKGELHYEILEIFVK
ncbi:MAG: transcription elongation factor GreA [Prosthecochloris sp.]|uniref:Transcription elongation factor GreA n=1 Tax=Prosthecochloris aestuarii (strain DSM 271 / SK 413) TaxID=290512 RepID=GREA_PROA2|nr:MULTISPECIES: transcription elongation factor GreA [Prosthecochloris]B4S9B2.1 RecName: Full=Transcription elongation factor GreA; AltName: Full=Transcript cleavage factor GreA [Prosthecochloris aestuarii DSM 271]ACF46582.1 transcription elongation factor GreA [Prosthecochloris aestuarii DSM 271]MCW8798351.1 transcription elongation factor GreA [Prosthecochloris sp.]NEX12087.1 transcription elongation factor GreA [Prosthecochloris sp.]RDD29873.1 transcription elongation factor GreA [Prosthec